MIRLPKLLLFILPLGGLMFFSASMFIFGKYNKELAASDTQRQFEINVREIRTYFQKILYDLENGLTKVEIFQSVRVDNLNAESGDELKRKEHFSGVFDLVDESFHGIGDTIFELIFILSDEGEIVGDFSIPYVIDLEKEREAILQSDYSGGYFLYMPSEYGGVELFLMGRKEIPCYSKGISCWIYAGARVSGVSGALSQVGEKINSDYIILEVDGESFSADGDDSQVEGYDETPESLLEGEKFTTAFGVHSVFDGAKLSVVAKSDLSHNLAVQMEQSYTMLAFAAIVYILVSYFTMSFLVGRSVSSVVRYAADVKNIKSTDIKVKRNIILEMQLLQDIFTDQFDEVKEHAQRSKNSAELANRQTEIARRAVKELEEQNMRLEIMNSQMEQFVYSTSHDLKSPLTSIQGLVSSAIDDLESADYESLDYVLNSISLLCSRMVGKIEESLNLIGVDHQSIVREVVDLPSIVEEVWGNIPNPPHGPVELISSYTNTVDIVGSQAVISGMLENLLGNACKYSSPDRDERRVVVTVSNDEKSYYISVSDNGIGIPEEFHGEVFKMFRRFDLQGLPGTGLGLSLVKKYAEKLSGKIVFNSTEEGSEFVVSWPLRESA